MTWLDLAKVTGALGLMLLGACAPVETPSGGPNSGTESDGGSTGAGSVTTATATSASTGTGSGSGGGSGSSGSGGGEPSLELGWGQFGPFQPLIDGGSLDLSVGGQGLMMFPIPLRATNVNLPPWPYAYDHPDAPLLDVELDVEGYDGFGGHFIYLANYPIPFEDWGDSWQFYYVALLLPDEVGGVAVDPLELDGRPARLMGRLRPSGQDPVVVEYDLTLRADIPG